MATHSYTRRVLPALLVPFFIAGCAPSVHDVVARGDIERLESMLAENPDLIHSRNKMEKTPLHYAVTNRKSEIIELLIERGAEVGAADVTGMTPLHVAATLNRVHEAILLLEAGADLEARDAFGDTALHGAAMHGQISILRELIKRGADSQAVNNQGLTPSGLAKKHRRTRAASVLDGL